MHLIKLIIFVVLFAVASCNPCEIAPDDEPCANDGKCVVISEIEFKCECSSDFEGEFCQNKNLCKYSPCQNGGSCVTFGDIAKCLCPIGYSGIHCEEGHGIGKKGTSTPKPTSSTSKAPNKDSSGLGRAIAINPRQAIPGNCNATSLCENGGSCDTVTGECHCIDGYRGTTCALVDKCHNACNSHGDCELVTDSSGNEKPKCKCDDLFTGVHCEHDNPCAKGTPCLNDGVCKPRDDGKSFYCDCPHGYLSEDCSERDPCVLGGSRQCLNGATCQKRDYFEFQCKCRIPYEGEHCEVLNLCNVEPGECIDDIATNVGNCFPCKNNGNCTQIEEDPNRYTCLCPDGYSGLTCETMESDEYFESPTHLQVFQKGTFYMEILNPSPVHEYKWNLDQKSNSPTSIKRINPTMLTKSREFNARTPPGSVRKEYSFHHFYKEPGTYSVEVTRILRTTGERNTVWRNRIAVEGMGYNPLIPTIVISTLTIYFILLILTCVYHCRNRQNRPRLIVSTDIQKFDEETFYLLTLQTGNYCDAGTSANVACRFYGEKGRSKIFVLRDYKLDTTIRDSESNFLISSVKHLGEMEKIRIWHDNTGYQPSWFCLKIILRELKSDKVWYFFIRRWLSITSDDTSIVAEATSATEKEIQSYYNEFTNLSRLWLVTKKHHIWISPFLGSSKSGFTVPERLTVAMTVLCSHFFALILCYGTPKALINEPESEFEFNETIIYQSLIIAPFTVSIGLLFTFLFRKLHEKRVPTLLVWRNKPDMPTYEEYLAKLAEEIKNRRKSGFLHPAIILLSSDYGKGHDGHDPGYLEFQESSEEEVCDDEDRWDKLDPNRTMVVGVPKSPLPETQTSESTGYIMAEVPSTAASSHAVFRIPSTDMLETRNWISETLDDSQGPVNVASRDLVHSIRPEKPFLGPDRLVELGMVGGVTSVKDDHPESFVYKTNSNESIKHLIEKDVRNSYVEPDRMISKDHIPGHLVKVPVPKKKESISEEPVDTIDENFQTDTILSAIRKGNIVTDSETTNLIIVPVSTNSTMLEQNLSKFSLYDVDDICCGVNLPKLYQVYLELCEMPLTGRRQESLTIIAWILSFFLIALTTSLTIYYGARYGRLLSLDWCASLGWSMLESFLIFQPLKILIVGTLIRHRVRKGSRPPLRVRHNRERFQLYCVNGLTVLPKMYPMNFQNHTPDILYRPIIASQIFALKMESRKKRLLRNGLKEVVVFVIFLLALLFIAHYHRGVDAEFYESAKTMEDNFLLRDEHTSLDPLAFKNIRNIDGYYGYLQNILVKSLYHERDPNGIPLKVDDTDRVIWMNGKVNFLIGIPRIRQLRIVPSSEADTKDKVHGTCDMRYQFKADKFTHPTTNFSCSTDFWDGYFSSNKDTKDYQLGWNPGPSGTRVPVPSLTSDIWKFRTAEETGSLDKVGFISWYDGSGYVAELGRVEAKTLGVVRYMRQYGWINERTRALFIEFSTYNPHILSSELDTFRTLTVVEIIAIIVFIACTIYFAITSVYCVIRSFEKFGWATLKNLWLWLDVLIPTLCITSMIVYVIFVNKTEKKLVQILKSNPHEYIDLQHVITGSYTEIYILCGIIVLSVCKLWHLLVISNRTFFVLGFLFSITTSYSMHFMLIFLLLHIAFASFNHLVFGTRDQRCKTIGSAIMNSLYSSRFPKDVDFDTLYISDSSFGPIYFFGINFLIYIFIMNVFISIYTLGLQEAKETALQRPFQSSYASYVWTKLQGLLPRRIRRQLTHTTHITPARLNQMKRIAISTLRAALNSPSPTEQRMMEMKAFAINYLKGTGLCLMSKQYKMMIKQKKIMLIEEDRLNTMRELTVNYIRRVQNIDFTVEELKKYEDFDYELLKIQIRKLKEKLEIVDGLLNCILQRL